MKKLITILLLSVVTTLVVAQESVTFKSVPNMVYTLDSVTISDITITEINEDSTAVQVNTHLYIIPMSFDCVLDVYLNVQYVIYKLGYISRKQYCAYKQICMRYWRE